jgi:hypothetical protein
MTFTAFVKTVASIISADAENDSEALLRMRRLGRLEASLKATLQRAMDARVRISAEVSQQIVRMGGTNLSDTCPQEPESRYC